MRSRGSTLTACGRATLDGTDGAKKEDGSGWVWTPYAGIPILAIKGLRGYAPTLGEHPQFDTCVNLHRVLCSFSKSISNKAGRRSLNGI